LEEIAREQRRDEEPGVIVLSGRFSIARVAFGWNDRLRRLRQLGPVRILIVDDFEPWRRAICSTLAGDGRLHVVGESPDGLDAVQQCEALRPHLVLLDIQLPKLSGFAAAARIREVSPDTKILFLSSYHSRDVMLHALKVGAGMVVKAEAARDLVPVIWAVIRGEPVVRFKSLDDKPWNF
jgi:DNA-binding NarL/FixJ family response regulator